MIKKQQCRRKDIRSQKIFMKEGNTQESIYLFIPYLASKT
jgi:hypothetical protein